MTENKTAKEDIEIAGANHVANGGARPFAMLVCLVLSLGSWALYCYWESRLPGLPKPWIDLAVQFACVAIPVLIFRVWTGFGKSASGFEFGFVRNWKIGAAIGALVAAGYVLFMWYDPNLEPLRVPKTASQWVELILLPFALELLFRSILATQIYQVSQNLDGAEGWDSWVSAIILSSVAFSVFLSVKMFFEAEVNIQFIVHIATSFGFGCAFTLFFLTTKSFWSSLLPHWAWSVWSALTA